MQVNQTCPIDGYVWVSNVPTPCPQCRHVPSIINSSTDPNSAAEEQALVDAQTAAVNQEEQSAAGIL